MLTYPVGVGGLLTRVLDTGGTGEVVVFAHGLGARADRWRPTLEAIQRAGFRGLAYDHLGHGFATKGRGPDYSIPAFADFLDGLLSGCGIENPVLVGTSLGGAVMATRAARHPDRVRALVLVGSMGLAPTALELRETIRRAVRDTSRDAIRAKLKMVFFDGSLVTEELVEEEHLVNSSPGADESFAALGDYVVERSEDDAVGDKLRSAGVRPVLVWGAEDRTIPLAIGEEAHRQLPGSRLVVIDGAAHAPYYEKPGPFAAVLLDVLRAL